MPDAAAMLARCLPTCCLHADADIFRYAATYATRAIRALSFDRRDADSMLSHTRCFSCHALLLLLRADDTCYDTLRRHV